MEIVRTLPSEAVDEIHRPNSKLVNLVLAGYNLKPETIKDPIEAALIDYNYSNDRAAVFLAKEGDEVIGSVTLILWKDTQEDKRGRKFWPRLRAVNLDIAQKAMKLNPLACDVGGVVVLPQARGQGIGQMLLERAVEEVNPSIIVGNTKTVEAVALRRKLVSQGYRTFFIDSETTPGHEQTNTTDHLTILQTYLYAKDYENTLSEGHVFVYKGGIAPTIPDTSQFPQIIKASFQPLITAQKRIGGKETVMGPLLAIRKEILA